MQAIECKYVGPTDHRGSRIQARAGDHRLTVPYPYDVDDSEAQYRVAAEALRDKLGWTGELIGGGTRTGYVFVFQSGSNLPAGYRRASDPLPPEDDDE